MRKALPEFVQLFCTVDMYCSYVYVSGRELGVAEHAFLAPFSICPKMIIPMNPTAARIAPAIGFSISFEKVLGSGRGLLLPQWGQALADLLTVPPQSGHGAMLLDTAGVVMSTCSFPEPLGRGFSLNSEYELGMKSHGEDSRERRIETW